MKNLMKILTSKRKTLNFENSVIGNNAPPTEGGDTRCAFEKINNTFSIASRSVSGNFLDEDSLQPLK